MIKIDSYISFILLLSLLFSTSCFSPKRPELNLFEESYDFGHIKKDSIYMGGALIMNSGNAPLIIAKVNPSCGCTSVFISKDTIMPKDTCRLTFNYATYNKMGIQENYICIIANTDSVVHLLQINAYVD